MSMTSSLARRPQPARLPLFGPLHTSLPNGFNPLAAAKPTCPRPPGAEEGIGADQAGGRGAGAVGPDARRVVPVVAQVRGDEGKAGSRADLGKVPYQVPAGARRTLSRQCPEGHVVGIADRGVV